MLTSHENVASVIKTLKEDFFYNFHLSMIFYI